MDAFLALPPGDGPGPGLLVFQEAFGVNAHIRDVAGRFADAGYAALAPELFHRSGRGVDVTYGDMPAVMRQLAPLTNEGLAADVTAALARLREEKRVDPARVGAVGFCMGGFVSFLAACRTDVATAVSFYGGGILRARPGIGFGAILDEAKNVRVPLLFHFGAEDPSIPPDDVEAIRARLTGLKKKHEIVVHPNAGHAFFSDPRPSYRPEAARDAWRRTLDWLAETLGGPRGARGDPAPEPPVRA